MTPQYIKIDKDGDKIYYKDKQMTIWHREDGPAVEYASGTKAWLTNGQYHRLDGPAVEWSDGCKDWWLNGRLLRLDGPAEGHKSWWINGRRHRTDGPAVEWSDGSKTWYLNGQHLPEAKFLKRTAPEIVLTMDEIAAKLGIEVSKLKIKK